MNRSDAFFRGLWQGGGSLIVWALHFFGVYLLVAAGCCTPFAQARWFGVTALGWSSWLLTALAVTGITARLVNAWSRPHGFLRGTGLCCGALALIGVIWTMVPATMLPWCRCG